MNRGLRLAALALSLTIAAGGAFVMAARAGWLKPDVAEMRAKYGLPTSRFVTIAGQPLHYVDEGQGPAIIMVHGSFASLRMWDDWARSLTGRYRVIRFDRPFMGLSGASPDGRSDGAAEAQVIAALADHLQLDRFALVATSSSGEGVAHYAARQPGRVSALVLSNIAAGPIKIVPGDYPLWFKAVLAADPWFRGWHPPAFWRGVLEANFADPRRISPALVQEWTDLNNLAQGAVRTPRPGGGPAFAETPADLQAIRAPTLLLWSDADHEVPARTHGQDALRLLGSADKALRLVGHCGHMLAIECGPQSAAPAGEFLDRVLPARR